MATKTTVTVSSHDLNAGDVFASIALAARVGFDHRANDVVLQFNDRDIHVDPSAPWAACGRWLHYQVCEYVSSMRLEITKLERRLADLETKRARAPKRRKVAPR